MADDFTTPVADGKTFAAKEIAAKLYPWNLLADGAGADAMGLVTASPAANTLLGRLKEIADAITTMDGHVDGLEGLATTLNGLVDGLEALGAAQATAALQTSGNATLTNIAGYLDTVEALLAAATPAGENYTGKSGGDVLRATASPAVTAGAYAENDVIGVKMTLAGMARIAAGSGIVQSIAVHCKTAQTGAMDLLLFMADPSASTFTDNGALAVNAADFDKLIGVVSFGEDDWTSLGTPSIAQKQGLSMPFKLPAGTSLYAVLVARSTPTLGSTSDITLAVNVIPG